MITAGGSAANGPVCSIAAVQAGSASARSRVSRAQRYAASLSARYSAEVCTQSVAVSSSWLSLGD